MDVQKNVDGKGVRYFMVSYCMLTNCGDRKGNEDYIKMTETKDGYCFVLADGLGGHGKGEVASQLVVENTIKEFQTGLYREEFLDCAFLSGQEHLMDAQKQMNATDAMKTTMVVLTITENQIRWGHIGDSRLYYFTNKRKLVKRTLDHSVPQMLVLTGALKEKEIRGHSDRNRLLRVMGVEWTAPKYELAEPIEVKGKQAFLLCTDGFWELITEKQMVSYLKKAKTVDEWVDKMHQEIKKNGQGKNMDNYSAIAVWID